MSASEIIGFFKEYNVIKHVGMDDFSDKLTFLYTVIINLACVVIVSARQYTSESITCFMPTSFTVNNFYDYITNLCWVHGTIPFRTNETVPSTQTDWEKLDAERRIVYYQWVPFVLCCQAIIAYLPRLVWQLLYQNLSSHDIENIMVLADKAVHSTPSERNNLLRQLVSNLVDMFGDQHRFAKSNEFPGNGNAPVCGDNNLTKAITPGRVRNIGLRWIYLVVKFLYLINSLLQLLFLQWLLNLSPSDSSNAYGSSIWFGVDLVRDIVSAKFWPETLNFPRVAYCYIPDVQHLGSRSNFVAQCALPLNMLNDKIFIVLWFWYCFIFAATLFSIIIWITRIAITRSQVVFIRKYMRFIYGISKDDFLLWRIFAKKFLHSDGIFILRMIKTNAGDLIVRDVIDNLWKNYKLNIMESDRMVYNIKERNPDEVINNDRRTADPLTVQLDSPKSKPCVF